MEAALRLDHHLVAVEAEGVVHAMLELSFPEPDTGTSRPPLHLALVIDRSGSMAGERLAAAQSCAELVARRLAPTDQMALVSFDDDVQLVAPLSPVHADQLVASVSRLRPGGSTNLSGGWLMGVEELARSDEEAATRRVILLSDGHANSGITDHARLANLARGSGQQGAPTTTVGIGGGFDEDLLAAMADASGGNAYFADGPEDAPAIFEAEFEGLISLVAQNLSVEIRPMGDSKGLGVLNDYPTIAVAGGGVQVTMGDAYGGEVRRVVFGFALPGLATMGPTVIAEAVVRWVSIGEHIEHHARTIPIVVNVVTDDDLTDQGFQPDGQVTEEVIRLEAARADKQARDLADRGDLAGAARHLRTSADQVRAHAPLASDPDAFRNLGDELSASADDIESAYTPTVRKEMLFRSREMNNQRFSGRDPLRAQRRRRSAEADRLAADKLRGFGESPESPTDGS